MKTLDGYEIEIGMILYGTFAMPSVVNPQSSGVKVMGFTDYGIRVSTGYPSEELGQHGLKAFDGVVQVYVTPPSHWIVTPYSDYSLHPENVASRSAVVHQKCDIQLDDDLRGIPTFDSDKSLIIPRYGHIVADYFAVCEVCGNQYRTKRKHTRTCSPACRKKLSRMGASKV